MNRMRFRRSPVVLAGLAAAAVMVFTPHQQHVIHCNRVPSACPASASASALAPLPVNTQLTGATADAWSRAALGALGAPATDANLATMRDWYANEGVPHDYSNPLGLKVQAGGDHPSDANGDPLSVDIQAYQSPADFVAAFATEIRTGGIDGPDDNGPYQYILNDLMSGNGMIGDSSAGLQNDLSVYSGNGYNSIPAAYCPCGG